ncbi:unnamed protein product, partial [Cladocopium goreaui]
RGSWKATEVGRAQWGSDEAMSLPLRIFVRDVQKGGRRVVAVPRNGASVARFSGQKLGEAARLTIDGFTIPSWECASQVFRDGDTVEILPEGKDPSQEKEPPSNEKPKVTQVKRPRAGFLTADLRRRLFGEAPVAAAESAHAQDVSLEEVEEPRSRVGLRLVSEAVDGWQTVLKDEGRRSFAAHRAQALPKDTAQRFLEHAMRDVNWQQPEGTWGPIPRKTSWMTRAPCCCRYGYGGLRMEPEPMAPWLLETMELCMPLCGIAKEDWPDSCNLNLYESGDHSVGWHSDDEFLFQGKFQDCLIISLSLGAPRCFELKTMCEPAQMQRLVLHGGDLCTMEGMLQKHYLHRVPKEHSTSPRVNLTWRWVKCHERRCSHARNPGGPFESRHQPLHESGGRKRAASTSGPRKKQKTPMVAPTAKKGDVLQMSPEARLKWLAKAFKRLAVKEFDPNVLLDIVMDPAFLEKVEDPVAPKIYRLIRGNQLKFTEAQSNMLEPVCERCARLSPEVLLMRQFVMELQAMKDNARRERQREEADQRNSGSPQDNARRERQREEADQRNSGSPDRWQP